MTREEALQILDTIPTIGEQVDALELAIEALSPEPCEDCISRAEAIEALGYDISIESDEGLDAYKTVIKEMLCKIYDAQKENIEKLPSIQPKPKMGHWITQWNVVHQKEYYYCSECREEFSYDGETGIKMNDYDYCPNCGAKMESE